MKQQFINDLKNGQVPFLTSEQEFKNLPDALFEPFNATFVKIEEYQHRWSQSYFEEKVIDLGINFSKELVQHLIDVKKYLQAQQPVKPVVQHTEPAIQNKPEVAQVEVMQAVKKTESFAKPDLLNFKPNEKLVQFLKEGETSKIRSYLMSMLNNRRLDLEEVFKSIWYVYQQSPNLFEQTEENAFVQPINKNENAWNADYFSQQQVYLNKNFSLERLLHLTNVRETLMKKGDSSFQQIKVEKEAPRVEPQTQTQQQSQSRAQQEQPSSQTQSSTQQSQPHVEREPTHTSPPSEPDNGFIKTLALVGGAVLALGLALFALFK